MLSPVMPHRVDRCDGNGENSTGSERLTIMQNAMPACGSLGLLIGLFLAAAQVHGADTLSALDLVAPDAAFCLEIPDLDANWAELEKEPMVDRLRGLPTFQRLLDSQVLQRWNSLEERASNIATQSLASQLRNLFAKSLVLAIYVPASRTPQGILVGEANNPQIINTVFTTLNKLEPKQVSVKKQYGKHRYIERKRNPETQETLYFASSDRWFAVSDQESLIHAVMDRFATATMSNPPMSLPDSLRQSESFVRNRSRLGNGGAAYIHINARHWDGSFEESSRGSQDQLSPALIWKRIESLAARVDFKRGLTCNSVIQLEKERLPKEWSQVVKTASADSNPSTRIPADAVAGFNGHLELAPIAQFALNQVRFNETSDFARMRRIAQSLFNGHDLFQTILPTLARDVHGYVVARKSTPSAGIDLDAKFAFNFHAPDDHRILADIHQGLETGLNLLAAYSSSEGQQVVIVQRDQTPTTQLQWLSEGAILPLAIGSNGQQLVLAGSPELVRRKFTESPNQPPSRLTQHAKRFFPKANQLIWFDTARIRQLLEEDKTVLARLIYWSSSRESQQLADQLDQWRPLLNAADSLFVAGRLNNDHLHVTFGCGLDSE